MATSKEKKSQRTVVRASVRRAHAALAGTFVFKFSGFANVQERPWYLTGMGHFEIDAAGTLTGSQRSTIMPISGYEPDMQTGTYGLRGTINVGNDNKGSANILFTKTRGRGKNLQAEFHVLLVGADRLWLIPSGGSIPETGDPSNELVILEAIRDMAS